MRISYTHRKIDIYSIRNGLEWASAILCIILMGSIWSLRDGSLIRRYNTHMRVFTLLLMALWAITFFNKKTSIKREKLISIVSIPLLIIPSFTHSMDRLLFSMVRVYLPIVCGLIILAFVPDRSFWGFLRKVATIVTLISLISLIFWCFGTLLKMIHPSGRTDFWWGNLMSANSYFNIYYEPYWQRNVIFGIDAYRNCGIFTEPPMFGYMLCIAYSVVRRDSQQFKHAKLMLIILLTTIFTTISSTAILYVLIHEVTYIVMNNPDKLYKRILKFILSVVIVIVALFIFESMVSNKLGTGSGRVRNDHMRVGLELFKSNMLTGVGFGNEDIFLQHEVYKQGISVGLPAVFGQGGIGIALFIIAAYTISLVSSAQTKDWHMFSFVVAFFWTTICTAFQFNSPISWIMICYLYGYTFNQRNT